MTLVTIDGNEFFDAVAVRPEGWNGFVVPGFRRPVLMEVIAYLNGGNRDRDESATYAYEPANDSVLVIQDGEVIARINRREVDGGSVWFLAGMQWLPAPPVTITVEYQATVTEIWEVPADSAAAQMFDHTIPPPPNEMWVRLLADGKRTHGGGSKSAHPSTFSIVKNQE